MHVLIIFSASSLVRKEMGQNVSTADESAAAQHHRLIMTQYQQWEIQSLTMLYERFGQLSNDDQRQREVIAKECVSSRGLQVFGKHRFELTYLALSVAIPVTPMLCCTRRAFKTCIKQYIIRTMGLRSGTPTITRLHKADVFRMCAARCGASEHQHSHRR
jgi:hypothetical protein